MMDERVAVYCGTQNLYPHMVVAAKSILFHNGADRVFFLIEDDVFPEPLPDCVSVMNVSGQSFFSRDGPNYNNRWSYMILIRAAFTKLFPQYDKILSLDVDTIVNKNIDGLWNIDISDAYEASLCEACHESDSAFHLHNFGVVMMNLAKLRDGTDDKIISALNTVEYRCPEQNAFDKFCRGHIVDLQPEYNAMGFTIPYVPQNQACIIHFAGRIAHRYDTVFLYRKYRRLSWDTVLARKMRGDSL